LAPPSSCRRLQIFFLSLLFRAGGPKNFFWSLLDEEGAVVFLTFGLFQAHYGGFIPAASA
jgi:hypothetical protein